MTLLLPVIASMLLGSAIDLRTYTPSTTVFNNEQFKKQSHDLLTTRFYAMYDTSQYYKLTGCEPDVILRIKAGLMKLDDSLDGINDFITDTYQKKNVFSAAFKIDYYSESHTLPENAETLKENLKVAGLANSTHYVGELHHGGSTIIVYDYITKNVFDKMMIEQHIIPVVSQEEDSLINAFILANEHLDKAPFRGPIVRRHRVFSTVSLPSNNFSHPSNIKTLIDSYRDIYSKNEREIPTVMFMSPLKPLDSSFDDIDHAFDESSRRKLYEIIELFDDLRETEDLMSNWLYRGQLEMTEEQEKKAEDLYENLSQVLKSFQEIIPEISQFKKLDETRIKEVIAMYNKNLPVEGGTYNLAFRILKETIGSVCQDEFHPRILGQLLLDADDYLGPKDGLGENKCRKLCLSEPRCRAYTYGEDLEVYDPEVGVWESIENRCWILFRSTDTADFKPTGPMDKVYTYDRKCA
ncbi:uncharacterized protein LOC111623837 isoform X2 [Centruroides sculpturatus]|uniref:uncharacterized protein LOC111623837 isoform X2 n=1 Tax=Centruroides sculpturatus TaxID=218467 RepID=UPI000C6E1447|nr:uncharacterized protein LOC111623837 isoform X2 [Centruroides sculpturatus]